MVLPEPNLFSPVHKTPHLDYCWLDIMYNFKVLPTRKNFRRKIARFSGKNQKNAGTMDLDLSENKNTDSGCPYEKLT